MFGKRCKGPKCDTIKRSQRPCTSPSQTQRCFCLSPVLVSAVTVCMLQRLPHHQSAMETLVKLGLWQKTVTLYQFGPRFTHSRYCVILQKPPTIQQYVLLHTRFLRNKICFRLGGHHQSAIIYSCGKEIPWLSHHFPAAPPQSKQRDKQKKDLRHRPKWSPENV